MRVRGLVVSAERARSASTRCVESMRSFAPQHVSDRHLEVVDRVGEEEDRRAVRSNDDEVAHRRPGDRHVAPDDVDELAPAVVGGAEPDRRRAALGDERFALRSGEVAAPSVVAGRPALGPRRLVAGLDLVLGAEALVRVALLAQALGRLEVPVEAGALENRAFVPVEPEPAQHHLDLLDGASVVERTTSVSSMRRMNVPPVWRA